MISLPECTFNILEGYTKKLKKEGQRETIYLFGNLQILNYNVIMFYSSTYESLNISNAFIQ